MNLAALLLLVGFGQAGMPERLILDGPIPRILDAPEGDVELGVACALSEASGLAAYSSDDRFIACAQLRDRDRKRTELERMDQLEERTKLARELRPPLSGAVVQHIAWVLDSGAGPRTPLLAVRRWNFWFAALTDERLMVMRDVALRLVPRRDAEARGPPSTTEQLVDPLEGAGGYASRPAVERETLIRIAAEPLDEESLGFVLRRPDVNPEPRLRALAQAELERLRRVPDWIRRPAIP